MEISCSIEYRTNWGESLAIVIDEPQSNDFPSLPPLRMQPWGDALWQLSLSISPVQSELNYHYVVLGKDGEILRSELESVHQLLTYQLMQGIHICDAWQTEHRDRALGSSAFTEVLFAHKYSELYLSPLKSGYRRIMFNIYCPILPIDTQLYIAGSIDALGKWNPQDALPLHYQGNGYWLGSMDIETEEITRHPVFEYKCFWANDLRGQISWEHSDNRIANCLFPEGKDTLLFSIILPIYNAKDIRFAGVVTPLFSLRSPSDWGIGDMGCLRDAIDWAKACDMNVLQLLPINDTTYYKDERDSYPYNAISVDALHPIYIGIDQIELPNEREIEILRAKVQELRSYSTIDYASVMSIKDQALWIHYDYYGRAQTKKQDFLDFENRNRDWLYPYSLFRVLREEYTHKSPSEWGGYSHYKDSLWHTEWINLPHIQDRILYYRYLQYLLHCQLSEVVSYAKAQRILIKGDIPIGVSPHGVDAWQYPELFRTDQSAGAPPDDFSLDGQNWGFPTYNWGRMKEDNFVWWRNRLGRMSQYFDAFRVDHILGFFRIWEIDRRQESGLLGHFYPALPLEREYWEQLLSNFSPVDRLLAPYLFYQDLEKLLGRNVLEQLISQGIIQGLPDGQFGLISPHQSYYYSLDLNNIEEPEQVRSILIELCKEVALVQDPEEPNRLHPRIALHHSLLYQHFSPELRDAWEKAQYEYFYLRHNQLWRQTALTRLKPILKENKMLVCAEDLGMIPATVPEVLTEMDMLSLDIERMPKRSTDSGFDEIERLPYHSVCSTSTHDMPPLRLWWKDLSFKEKECYWQKVLRKTERYSDKHDKEALELIFEQIIRNHLSSPSMLTILPLTDWTSMFPTLWLQSPEEEQINHPENQHHRWCYRFPLPFKGGYNSQKELIHRIRTLIGEYGRGQ